MNERLLQTLDPEHGDVILRQVEAAEMDEMWSFVGSKSQQRWLWHAIEHHTGQILAYVFGTREDETFSKLKELLAPFGIAHFYTDGWGAYRRHLDLRTHTVGKQHTQKIERKHPAMPVVEDDDMIEHLATDAPDAPLAGGIVPRTARGDVDFFDTDVLDAVVERHTGGRVAIP